MNIRIYKDNIRENIFRSLLFTDFVLFALGGFFLAIILWYIFQIFFRSINIVYYISVTVFIEIIFFSTLSLHIDNQPIYKIIARAIPFFLKNKQFRGNTLQAHFSDLYIQDDRIIRRKSVNQLFEITPYDISAINNNEREQFFTNLKQALHMLPSQLQVLVQKEVAKPKDFTDHFLSIYKTVKKGDTVRENLINQYQNDFEDFITSQQILTIKQYGVLSASADTTNPKAKIIAIGKTTDMFERLKSALETCKVTIKQLSQHEISALITKLN